MSTYLTAKAVDVITAAKKQDFPSTQQLAEDFITWVDNFFEAEGSIAKEVDKDDIIKYVIEPILKKIVTDPIFVLIELGLEYINDLYSFAGWCMFINFLEEKGLIKTNVHDETEVQISSYC
ncbi:MAG: hypothetical protein GXO10_04990 [Crenarchaeota archaeon]|nr:hypothetical protein [Thermoproteota archaeon]